jgi:prepilin-type N-terminal cleavage/methylation domain-containing protein
MKRHSGFSLVEVLVAMTMMTITMAGFYSVYRMQTRTMKSQENRLQAQQDARVALDFMVREIRNTGYNPTKATSGNNCGDGAPGNPGIIAASEQTFHFSYDADGDGHCTSASENIKYEYNGTSKDVTRAADGGAAQNLSDGNTTNFQFIYYPQQTSGAAPAPFCFTAGNPAGCSGTLASNLTNVNRVSIAVTVESENPDEKFGGGQLIATIASNVDLRNRGSL